MKKLALSCMMVCLPLAASANCIPPWQTQFACDIANSKARAEFCRISNPKEHPGKREAYYTYSVGTEPTELYFETDSIWFSTKDTNISHPTDLTMAIGYANGNYVYSFTVTEDKVRTNTVRDGEIRVYPSTDSFTSEQKGTEALRLYCKPSSIIADLPSIRP